MKPTARIFTIALMLAAVAACSAMQPPGTVRLDEEEFAATLEEAEVTFQPVISLVSETTAGEVVVPGSGARTVRCGEPYADDLAEIYAQAVVLIDGRPEEDAIIDELEPQMESLGWTREVNPSTERSRFVRTTETGVTLDLFIGVNQGPDTPRNSDLRLSISGSCMRLPASPFELGY